MSVRRALLKVHRAILSENRARLQVHNGFLRVLSVHKAGLKDTHTLRRALLSMLEAILLFSAKEPYNEWFFCLKVHYVGLS